MHRPVRYPTLLFLLLLASGLDSSASGNEQGPNLPRYSSYAEAGFSAEKLEAAKDYMDSKGRAIASAVVVYRGKVLLDWGYPRFRYKCHSVRKGLLSSLYGIHVAEGNINLESTLAELDIDDSQALTDAEKQAQVIHLLKSRSGVYLPAAAETDKMRAKRPPRGSHALDSHYYYNNWNFNALGTIFEQQTGRKIFEEFDNRIAKQIGMQDFDHKKCFYDFERQYSEHPAYNFRMSTRDRARFGLLYLQKGKWADRQVVSEEWVTKCMTAHSSNVEGFSGVSMGIMWGILSKNAQVYGSIPAYAVIKELKEYDLYMLTGYGGQMIALIPEKDLVYAVSGDTENGIPQMTGLECLELLDQILGAMME